MQPTISIPQHWDYPRFALEQRTKDGIILGLHYYPNGTELAEQFGDGWRYVLMPNKNSDPGFLTKPEKRGVKNCQNVYCK
ncbi:hypothetical protein LC653_38640 [Nostoc sp. CHAB 5784]|uniref:hypothetical protein n=1 Tax=Nostoc mirabile TaxID=2907820 RepID=UPI001E3FBDBE|nr:hypothetical protein [Nostoc mirabile]MCC5669583.1 hypothetical protein [Nostoc mirabile CHAB5784]